MPIDDYLDDKPDKTETGPGKYIKISVPNFNLAPDDHPSEQMTSYLRIGAVEDLTASGKMPAGLGSPNVDPTGEDLASLVTGFADDTRIRDGNGTSTDDLPAIESVPPGSPTASTGGTITMRTEESGFLHKKGGWRDHSDGNRITTTRGDKVEVIRGNYKLLVLGRRDAYDASRKPDYSNAAGWDVSGGLVDTAQRDFANTSGEPTMLDTEYVWKINSDGRWGWTLRTKTGSYNPTDSGNGKTIAYTWVDESWTYVGSPDLDVSAPDLQITNPDAFAAGSPPRPVKMMVNKTWAETMITETHATNITTPSVPHRAASLTAITTSDGDMTENTAVTGTHNVTTSAGVDQNETYNVTGTHQVTTNAGTENDRLIVRGDLTTVVAAHNLDEAVIIEGTHSSSSHGSALTESITYDTHTCCNDTLASAEVDLGFISATFNLLLMVLEFKLAHVDIHNIHLDVHLNHLDFHLGPHTTIDMFTTWKVHLEPENKIAPAYLWI